MKQTLFLVMDMTNDIVAEDGFNKATYGVQVKTRSVLASTAAAIAAARAAGARVGYVRVGFSPDYRECPPASPIFSGARANGIFQLGTHGTEVHPAVAPQAGDFDIVKHRVSPFYATSLEPSCGRTESNGSSCAGYRPTASSIPAHARRMTATTRLSSSKIAAPG